MIRRNRNLLTLAVLTLAMLVMAATPANAGIIGMLGVLDDTANGGINPATSAAWAPGDTYRLAFYTEDKRDALSGDIADYNSFVQSVAAGSTAFPLLGNGTWKVLGSTATVSARQNTGTDDTSAGVGEPIFVLDGTTMIAADNADMWNGFGLRFAAADSPNGQNMYYSPYLNEDGVEGITTGFGTNVVTGTHVSGGPSGGDVLGDPDGDGERVAWGSSRANTTGRVWARFGKGDPNSNWSFYVLSDPLFVGDSSTPAYTWELAGAAPWASANWNDGTTSGQTPVADADMTIDVAGSNVTVEANVTAASIALGATSNAKLIVSDPNMLSVTGTVDVGADATLTVDGTLTATSAAVAGTLAGSGTIHADPIDILGTIAPGGAGIGTLTLGSGEMGLDPLATFEAQVSLAVVIPIEADGSTQLATDRIVLANGDAGLQMGGTLAISSLGDRTDAGYWASSPVIIDNPLSGPIGNTGGLPYTGREFDAVTPAPPAPGEPALHLGQGLF
ncbi:MAG: hypothetical protein HQ567_05110, partial [Candidatus Nealsonbacteria bacterium]|nr:hypothetical protein [Candidatus Nealsonbacteria bacterium]